MKTLATSLSFLLGIVVTASGQSELASTSVLIVDAQGSGYTKIQDAIDAAQSGDLVLVMPGTYQGPGNRDLDFHGKSIAVQSSDGPVGTVIDCQGTYADVHRAFVFHSGEDNDSRVEGFTIRNGYIDWPLFDGGAIYCLNSSPTLKNNIFENSRAPQGYGGGIYCLNSSAVILRNRFELNQAGSGGGAIAAYNSNLRVERNFILTNSSSRGGGVYQAGTGTLNLTHNLIRKNYASGFGGGVYVDPESSLLCVENDVVENQSSDRGGGLYGGASVTALANNFLKNKANTYGGGLFLGWVATGSLEDNRIEGNSATNGAGLVLESCAIPMQRNRILLNVASGNGGGLWVGLYASHQFVLESDAFAGNQATNGGGIYARDYHVPLTPHFFLNNATMSGNQASSKGGALYLESTHPFADIRNSILWGNTAANGAQVFHTTSGVLPLVSNSDVEGGMAGAGNIDLDPLFAADGFHIGANSPCLDQGNSSIVLPGSLDIDREARIKGAQVDMGADEF